MKKMMVRAAPASGTQHCDFAVFARDVAITAFPGDGHQHDGHLRWGHILRSGAYHDLQAMVSAPAWKLR